MNSETAMRVTPLRENAPIAAMSPDARELLDVIVLAMMCPDPTVAMDILGDGVAITLAVWERAPRTYQPTPFYSDGYADPPPYTESAEYHYAMAARERALREG